MPTDGTALDSSARTPELAELARVVDSVARQVASFLAGSETVFLETGGALERLRGQALSLVGTAAGVVAAGVVEEARGGDSDPVEALAQGCRQIDRHLAASRSSLDAKSQRLRGVLVAIERLGTFRHLFRRAASALRMLGMSTSIENARAGMESTGFGTVATDVRRLGGLVESKLDSVLEEALAMKVTASEALARVVELARRQGERASSMLSDAAAGLESLRALARAVASVGAMTSGASNRIVASVDRVVISLQVHDITRQMMEHALQGLTELADPADALDPIGPGELVLLCRLQGGQLGQARAKLDQALRSIPTNLQSMSAAAGDLADQTCRLGEQPRGGSLLQGVERGVAQALSTLREQLAQEAEIERAMDRVMATITEMLTRLRDVERIGHDLKIIGLNAGIEAAKTTQGGKVLSVLARAIQELSIEVGEQTAAFAGVVHEIADQARSDADAGASGRAAVGGAAIGAEGEQITRELDGLLANLRAYSHHLVGAIASLVEIGGSLGRGVDEVSMRVRRQEDDLVALAAAEHELGGAVSALSAHAAPAPGGQRSERLARASARYTVEAERAVHQAIVGASPTQPYGGAFGAAPAQAFRTGRAPGVGTPAAPATQEFGDNVELF